MERESFVFYVSFLEGIEGLTDEGQLKVYKAVTNFALRGIEPTNLEGIEKSIFALIKPQILANNKKYKNGCSGGEFGKLGGRPKNKTKNPNGVNKKTPKGLSIKTPNENENDNENVNDNVNVNVNENDNKALQPQQPVALASKKKTPQAIMCEYFKERYKINTGLDYLTNNEDFIILADLIKKYGMDQVKQRIDWLETSCLNSVFWFAKSINDFTIGTLRKQWNKILQPLTEEQRRKQQEKRKEEETMRRVLENVKKRREEEQKWNIQ